MQVYIIGILYIVISVLHSDIVFSQATPAYTLFEMCSSFQPLGAGARATGRGGAFLSNADDATAASWNPGTLIQVKRKYEFSIVKSFINRFENLDFDKNPEATGKNSVNYDDINFASITYPFIAMNRNMVVSLSYQKLYDFNRRWYLVFNDNVAIYSFDRKIKMYQEGMISSISLSYCFQLDSRFSTGFTINIFDNKLSKNKWKQVSVKDIITKRNDGYVKTTHRIEAESFEFKGYSINIGLLYIISPKINIGAIYKSRILGNLPRIFKIQEEDIVVRKFNEEIELPDSYGIGVSYKFIKNGFIAIDFHFTRWDEFLFRDINGYEISPVTGQLLYKSDVHPATQVRLGIEYKIIDKMKKRAFPLRAGFFYDPAPSHKNPDDIFGLCFGFGYTLNNWYSIDFAYQYRFGNDLYTKIYEERGFSLNLREHKFFVSMILYQF